MIENGRRVARLEHHLLATTASLSDLHEAVSLCTEHRLDSLVVSPWLAKAARRALGSSQIALGTVVAYPHGGQLGTVKAYEASKALEHGATQIDFMLNVGALVSGEDEIVSEDLRAVIDMAHSALAFAGVILEAEPMRDAEARRACRLAERAGADYVVTSTGDASPAATTARVSLARDSLGPRVGVKAAGRFRAGDEIRATVEAGASRVAAAFDARLLAEIDEALPIPVLGR